MTFNVSLIQLNGKVNSVRNAVVSVLTEKWPLNAKDIYHETKTVFGLNVSYQAVHKMIKSLEEEYILLKQGKSYKLNPEWIEKTRQFSEQLSDAYAPIKKDGPTIVLPSLYETDKFLLNLLLQNSPKEGEKPFLGLHWIHFWVPLFLPIKEYTQIKELISKFDLYALCRGNTKVDKWCAKFWDSFGVKKKTGVDCAAISDLVIYQDFVIEVFYPTEIKKELDKFYENVKKIEDLDVQYIFENIFKKKAEISVIIHKNGTLAEQLKEQTTNYFR